LTDACEPPQSTHSSKVGKRSASQQNCSQDFLFLAGTVCCIAQLNEMIGDPEYKIGRPRQLYTDSVKRDVMPLAKR
jgi:hypothetical protein